MNIKMDNYKCSVCGKTHVKLWRPYMSEKPLFCAECAEKMQSPYEYDEVIWTKNEEEEVWTGTFTKRKLPLPRWTVDAEGKVPDYRGPGPEGQPKIKTDQLIVDLSGIDDSWSKNTTLVPAVPDEDDKGFWGYTSVPPEFCKWWDELPTR